MLPHQVKNTRQIQNSHNNWRSMVKPLFDLHQRLRMLLKLSLPKLKIFKSGCLSQSAKPIDAQVFTWQGCTFNANHSACRLLTYTPNPHPLSPPPSVPVRSRFEAAEKCQKTFSLKLVTSLNKGSPPEFLLVGAQIAAASFVLIHVKNFSNLISPECVLKFTPKHTSAPADTHQRLSAWYFWLRVGWGEGLEDEDYLLIPSAHTAAWHLSVMCFHTLSRAQTHTYTLRHTHTHKHIHSLTLQILLTASIKRLLCPKSRHSQIPTLGQLPCFIMWSQVAKFPPSSSWVSVLKNASFWRDFNKTHEDLFVCMYVCCVWEGVRGQLVLELLVIQCHKHSQGATASYS